MSHVIHLPIDFINKARNAITPDDRLKLLREVLGDMLMERAHGLNEEAQALKSDMEAVLTRLRWHSADQVVLSDIKTANWHRVKTEIVLIQHFIRLVAILQNEAPGVPVAPVVRINDIGGK